MAIPVTIETEVYQGKSSRSANFGMEFSAKLARTLSATLYTHKVEACVREYATNITDSHNDSGKRGLAGKIHLPTYMEPWFEAEDFGLGMTEDTIYNIFTVYGKSTKEEDNSTNGCLGYGSKVGFSVGDQFTIISVKNGVRTVVVCYKDRTGLPTADTKSITNTLEGNGTRVRVPVNIKDIDSWHKNGARVLGAFEVQHEVNTFGGYTAEFEAVKEVCAQARAEGSLYLSSKDAKHFKHRDSRFVLMGDVLYAISSWKDLVRSNTLKDVSETLTGSGLYITHLPIGSCDFAPSRESVSLDSKTFNILSKRVTSDVIKHYRNLMKEVRDTENSSWYLFYKKFYGSVVWDTLRDYVLPFTNNYKLGDTAPSYGYRGDYRGNRLRLIPETFNLKGLVPNLKNTGSVYNTSVRSLHQDRVSRMVNVILVTSDCGVELKKSKETLEVIAAAHPTSNTVLYCTSDTLANAKAWFGVGDSEVVRGEDYTPVKVKKPRQKGESRGGFGVTEDFHTVAKVITEKGTEFGKVDLSEEGLFCVEGDYAQVKGIDGTLYNLRANCSFEKWVNLGVQKIVVVNKTNGAKIKRNKVKSLSSHVEGLVKKKQALMIKHKVINQTHLYFDDKDKMVLNKVRSYKKFNRVLTSIKSDKVVETLLRFSNFGLTSSPKYEKEMSSMDNLKTSVYNELRDIKEKLPLWDSVRQENLGYYLKLEKFIK
jgi:hypothetical protein